MRFLRSYHRKKFSFLFGVIHLQLHVVSEVNEKNFKAIRLPDLMGGRWTIGNHELIVAGFMSEDDWTDLMAFLVVMFRQPQSVAIKCAQNSLSAQITYNDRASCFTLK